MVSSEKCVNQIPGGQSPKAELPVCSGRLELNGPSKEKCAVKLHPLTPDTMLCPYVLYSF